MTEQLRQGRLPPLALDAKEMEKLWQALVSADPREAHKATWNLAACADSATFLAERLRPIGRLEGKRLKKLLADLDADDFVVHERATQQLAGLGQSAALALRKEIERETSAEAIGCSRQLLKRLESAVAVAENRRTLRAVAALEASGGADARRLMMALSKGSLEATLTQAAAAALRRLEQRAVP